MQMIKAISQEGPISYLITIVNIRGPHFSNAILFKELGFAVPVSLQLQLWMIPWNEKNLCIKCTAHLIVGLTGDFILILNENCSQNC